MYMSRRHNLPMIKLYTFDLISRLFHDVNENNLHKALTDSQYGIQIIHLTAKFGHWILQLACIMHQFWGCLSSRSCCWSEGPTSMLRAGITATRCRPPPMEATRRR